MIVTVAATPESNFPIDTLDGGKIKQLSYNPVDGGSFLAYGDSHEQGGIKVDTNGDGKPEVEIEGGETLHQDSQNSTIIGGNLTVPGTKTKFKKAFKDIAHQEIKATKTLTGANNLLSQADPENKYGVLKYNSGNIQKWSAGRQQVALAGQKEQLTQLQEAMHQVADSMNVEPKDLNKMMKFGGKLPEFRKGGNLSMAERNNNPGNMRDVNGNFIRFNSYEEGLAALNKKLSNAVNGKSKVYSASGNLYDFYNHYAPASDNNNPRVYAETVARKLGVSPTTPIKNLSDKLPMWAQATAEQEDIAYSRKRNTTPLPLRPAVQPIQPLQANQLQPEQPLTNLPLVNQPLGNPVNYNITPTTAVDPILGIKQNFTDVYNKPKVKTSLADRNKLGIQDFAPEIAALFDRPDSVQHQRIEPTLYTPYNVSFQDRLNANNSSFNSVQQNLVNNPEALSVLAGQKYSADGQVLAQQFQTNQGIDNDITNKNIQLINQAKQQNLGLQDQQYVRQVQSRENTKANQRAAINSFSGKLAQNRLENNNIRMLENTFSFRPDNQMNMQYQGPDAQFNTGLNNRTSPQLDPTNNVTYQLQPDGTYKAVKVVDPANKANKRFWGGKLKKC